MGEEIVVQTPTRCNENSEIWRGVSLLMGDGRSKGSKLDNDTKSLPTQRIWSVTYYLNCSPSTNEVRCGTEATYTLIPRKQTSKKSNFSATYSFHIRVERRLTIDVSSFRAFWTNIGYLTPQINIDFLTNSGIRERFRVGRRKMI